MTTNYIYLLQEREFIKTNENIYKIGMTEKENHTRFNQYPKGSVLLFQMICQDCKCIEKQLLKQFKTAFKHKKDIGNEYFEGNYTHMIDIIYSTIKDEANNNTSDSITTPQTDFVDNDDAEYEDYMANGDKETTVYVTTYDEWIKFNDICKIIITNRKTEEGFLKLRKGHLWRKLANINSDEDEENLQGYIKEYANDSIVKNNITNELISFKSYCALDENNKGNYIFVDNVEYNAEQILHDTLNKCYLKNPTFYDTSYHEYVCYNHDNKHNAPVVIYNALTCTFTPIDDIIGDRILTEIANWYPIYVKDNINIDIVDSVLNTLISPTVKLQYKKLAYNLLVKQEEKHIVFYDYNAHILSIWLTDLLFHMSKKQLYAYSYYYYENKIEFKRALKTHDYRLIIISSNDPTNISIEKQISDFRKMGFKYFIVRQSDKHNKMYDISNYKQYLRDNKDMIMNCIKEENNYQIENYERDLISFYEGLFYSPELLLTNFLKWCCVK